MAIKTLQIQIDEEEYPLLFQFIGNEGNKHKRSRLLKQSLENLLQGKSGVAVKLDNPIAPPQNHAEKISPKTVSQSSGTSTNRFRIPVEHDKESDDPLMRWM
ncbi:hypothetical protein [Undibacterium oligocarboniphilum]|uniref:Uncharacterized protein n=1 Tax=Undibacterium oligocarboniphilum TaxID=666702 RepID=A0A850QSD6_9BURK|nr:hypothetical protein [Undibacterium oligocarboniphilum]MBC3871468.1 hypothetical protein [Undibacterium oligocarboniphilum]NVO78956.1 hypothetical protein [Undibacterium oligocarboniphilum]